MIVGSNQSIRVIESFGAVVQDLGRFGYEKGGISRSGASDVFSARFANLLLGNTTGAPCVELTGAGLAFESEREITFSVTGGVAEVRVDGDVRVPQWEAVTVPPRTRVDIGAPVTGYRVYLALPGGVRAKRLYGSVSPLPPLGFANDVASGGTIEYPAGPVGVPAVPGAGALAEPFRARLGGSPHRIGVLETEQAGMFEGMELLYANEFTMSPRSNAVGARFDGDTPVRRDLGEVVSRSVPIGSIEIPSAGELIALLRGRFITAGYPVPAVIAKADIDTVAQLRPGSRTAFERIDETEARYRLLDQELALRRLTGSERVTP